MGTRGAYGFRIMNEDKVTYNHYDSYPEGLGVDVIEFIKDTEDKEIIHLAKTIKLVDPESEATLAQIEKCKEWADTSVAGGELKDWYVLLRKAQGDFDCYKKGLRFMIDGHNMLMDSGYCEYAYIINCDKKIVEFYASGGAENGRYLTGVSLKKEYSFETIRSTEKNALVADMQDNSGNYGE